MASGGPSMYHPWPSMEFAMTTYKLDPLVARPGPSMAMDGTPWSLSTGTSSIVNPRLKCAEVKISGLELFIFFFIFYFPPIWKVPKNMFDSQKNVGQH